MQPNNHRDHLHDKGTDKLARDIRRANAPVTLSVRALGLAFADVEYEIEKFNEVRGSTVHLDAAMDRLENAMRRIRNLAIDAKVNSESAFKVSAWPIRTRVQRLGLSLAGGVPVYAVDSKAFRAADRVEAATAMPIVSIGPSGLGGYAQAETMDESGFGAGAGVGR